ncbi:MAG TPA: hypothetical protein VF691_22010 [Cytophagaceae bacterium]
MKNIIIFAALMMSLTLTGYSQRSHKNDPTYSTRNYKQPNKAKVAAEEGYEQTARLEYLKPSEESAQHNYKNQMNYNRRRSESGGVISTEEATQKQENSVFSNRNYKRQF